jgi:hypothetical protein
MTVTNGKARDVAGDAGEKAQSRMREPAGLAGDKQTKDKANGRTAGEYRWPEVGRRWCKQEC